MAVRCKFCHCPHCPAGPTEERTITYRGRKRTFQRRWRRCRNCGRGFWTREFNEDDEAGEPSKLNPLYHDDPRADRRDPPPADDSNPFLS